MAVGSPRFRGNTTKSNMIIRTSPPFPLAKVIIVVFGMQNPAQIVKKKIVTSFPPSPINHCQAECLAMVKEELPWREGSLPGAVGRQVWSPWDAKPRDLRQDKTTQPLSAEASCGNTPRQLNLSLSIWDIRVKIFLLGWEIFFLTKLLRPFIQKTNCYRKQG